MRRRQVLAAAGSLALAGCLGDAVDDSPSTATRSTTTPRQNAPVSVAAVETYEAALRMNHMGEDPGVELPAVSSFTDRQQDFVNAAIDGGYETDAVPTWLAQFLFQHRYVERDSTYYHLDADVPTYVVTAQPVERSAVDGRVADTDTYLDAVTYDGLRRNGLVRRAARGEYRRPYVWPDLRSLLDEYDAVRAFGTVYQMSLSVEDPGAPYTVTATEAPPAELAGGEVLAVDDFDPAYRDVIRQSAVEPGVQGVDSVPDATLDRLESAQLVHVDGRYYNTYVDWPGDLPVSFDVTAAPGEDGAHVTFSLTNEGDQAADITSGPPTPFGILQYEAVEGDERGFLWTDAYEDSEHLVVEDGEVRSRNLLAVSTDVPPGETATRTYTFDPPAPGRYVVEHPGALGVSVGDADADFPFRVELQIGE